MVGKDLAGNYVTGTDYGLRYVRNISIYEKMLSSTPYQTSKRPSPSCCVCLCGKDSACFAMYGCKWSSFVGNLGNKINVNCNLHLPVQNPAYAMFSYMIPFAMGVEN